MAKFKQRNRDVEDVMEHTSKAVGGCGKRTHGKCTACPRTFNVAREFNNQPATNEYYISGMCAVCQKRIFWGGDEGD